MGSQLKRNLNGSFRTCNLKKNAYDMRQKNFLLKNQLYQQMAKQGSIPTKLPLLLNRLILKE